MNKAILCGHVGKDPEVRSIANDKKVAKFSLATNKSYMNHQGEKITETSWHNIVLWGKLAELAEKYVKKGNSVIIEGEISYRSYENKDGVIVYITEIIGNALHFVGSKKDEKPENNEGKFQKNGKITTGSMSDISELPGNINDGSIPDDSNMPF
jgi:single-strand DNA-binding protein